LETYDKYWDNIRIEKTYISHALSKGEAIGEARGKEIGIAHKNIEIILNLFDNGSNLAFITKVTNTPRFECSKFSMTIIAVFKIIKFISNPSLIKKLPIKYS
jgi:hypothetical protein